MDIMINTEYVKKLRLQKAWSQEQLATITGLSLRTIQRIENEGSGSLESQKALAAAFQVEASVLAINPENLAKQKALRKSTRYGYAGATIGLIAAYAGITHSLINNVISAGEAGIYYGGIGAFCGLCCSLIGYNSRQLQTDP